MKAWLFTGVDEPLKLIERETPRPGPGEVLLEVHGAGLCGSDLHIMNGTVTHLLSKVPLVLGHEVAGVVVATGEGVADYQPGDRVIASGTDTYCPGFHTDGGYATHCLLAASSLRRIPDGVSFVQGAAATDAGQTSYSAVMRAGALQKGQRVGIVGLGGVGLTAARIAVVNGAAEVYAAEPRRDVWQLARDQGVKEVVEDVSALAQYKLDLIIDCAGFGTTTAGAIAAVNPGGLVVLVGAAVAEATIPSALLVNNEVTLRGAKGGHAGDTEAVLAHMQRGELEILASTISFDEIPDGLARLERGGVTGRLVAEPHAQGGA
ncbi:alcohol dehydrogenase catalytic domain-containing protein [Burkholderia anthina]|uniref:alcohol dehydrogenase catalytic domain-containing protein n=1 Tax=Burkholderia anthina TaxID=179879 RepID=UPI00158EA856